jgi:hypothetical protein
MKTKTRTLIVLFALGIIGITNVNAIADNKESVNTEVSMEKIVMLTNVSTMTEESFFNEIEALTAMEADQQIEKYATKQIRIGEKTEAMTNSLTSAEFYTASGVEQIIENFVKKQVSLVKTKTGK